MVRKILSQIFGGSDSSADADEGNVESGVAFGDDAPEPDKPEPMSPPPSDWDIDHYTEVSDIVKNLKREERHEEALELLNWAIDETVAEVEDDASYVERPAPWYFEHAAIVYRKEKRYADEVAVLERYQDVAGGRAKTKLTERLERARELAAKNESGE